VLRNNQKASKRDIIAKGDRIEVIRSALVRDIKLIPQNIPLEILYEDEYFVAVNKPSDWWCILAMGFVTEHCVNALFATG
jgi:23S rRNA pseudouridine1911/1915/1917 synthase